MVRGVYVGQLRCGMEHPFLFSSFPENLKHWRFTGTALDLHFLASTDSRRSLQF